MARLPQPGGDNGNWGSILNEYLSQSHKADGTIKDNAVTSSVLAPNSITNTALASNSVNTVTIADGAITNTKIANDAVSKTQLTSGLRAELDAKLSATTADATYATTALALVPPRAPMLPVSNMLAPAFASGHGWTLSGAVGSSTPNDTSDFALGSQCFSYVTNGTGGFPNLEKTLSSPVSLTGKYLRLWFKVDDYTKLADITLWFGDSTLTSYYYGEILTGSLAESGSILKSNEWISVDVAPEEYPIVAGSPSYATISKFRIRARDKSAGAVKFSFGGIALVDKPARASGGMVSLTFDDSALSAYTVARPRMDTYGYVGTLFPIIEQVDQSGRISLDQMRRLQNLHGWEIGSHGLTNTLHGQGAIGRDETQFRAELLAIRNWNTAHGFRGENYAYGVGWFDIAGEKIVSEYFRSARINATKILSTIPADNPYRIRAMSVNSGTSVASIQAAITKAKDGGTWLVLVFHDLVPTGAVTPNALISTFDGILSAINSIGVPVRTVAQVLST